MEELLLEEVTVQQTIIEVYHGTLLTDKYDGTEQ